METLEDLFAPLLHRECQVTADISIEGNSLIFACFNAKSDIAEVSLPLGLCAEMDPVARKPTEAKGMPRLQEKPITDQDLVGRIEGHNEMNKDLLSDGELPIPISDHIANTELFMDAEEMDLTTAAVVAKSIRDLFPLWVEAKGVPTLQITEQCLVITDGCERTSINNTAPKGLGLVLQGIVKLYPDIVVI